MKNVLICLALIVCNFDKLKANLDNSKREKYLTTNFTVKESKPYIDVFIGFPGSPLSLSISQDMNFSYISKEHKQPSFTTIKKEAIDIHGLMISTELISDLFAVHSEEMLSYSLLYFYYIPNIPFSETHKQNVLSLVYEFNHNNYSLVHNFLHDKYIDQAQFTMYPTLSYMQQGKIIFGKPPSNLTLNKYIAKCKIIQKHNNKWNSNLNKISFSHNKKLSYIIHPENEFSYFAIDDNIIIAPYSFLSYLEKYVFNSYIQEHTCFYKITDNLHYFYCDCRFINEFPEFVFHFGKYEFVLNKRDLFEETGIYRCNFNIIGNYNKFWKIGRSFLMKYISTWDYDKSEIRFYNDKPFGEENLEMEMNSNENVKVIQTGNSSIKVMKFVCGLLLINIFILLFIKIIFNKNKYITIISS